jgi:hypothetical protein
MRCCFTHTPSILLLVPGRWDWSEWTK